MTGHGGTRYSCLLLTLCVAGSLTPAATGIAEGPGGITGPGIDTPEPLSGRAEAAESSAPPQGDSPSGPEPAAVSVAEALQKGHDALIHNDFSEALRWYREAANQGDTDSQYIVGWIYFNGEGKVPQDLEQARLWIARAAAGGNKDAQAWLERFVAVNTGAPSPSNNADPSGSWAVENRKPEMARQNDPPQADSPTSSPLAYGAASERYNYAFGLLRQGDYTGAEVAFREFLQSYPGDSLAGNAQYWLGETYFVRGDFTNAAAAFEVGRENYPQSSKGADNLLKLGMALGYLGKKTEACPILAGFNEAYPKAPPVLRGRALRQRKSLGC